MSKLISIGRESHESVLLNPDHIVAVEPVVGGSVIYTTASTEERISKIRTHMDAETLREIIDKACE